MNKAYIYAISASLFWGAGFIGSRYALSSFPPMWITFFRFTIAVILLSPLLLKISKKDLTRPMLEGSIVSGLLLMFMMFFQIKGVENTTIAKSSFITITYAFITPVLSFFIFKENLTKYFVFTVLLSLVGILLLCDMNFDSLNFGDLLIFISAIFTSFQLILLSNYLQKIDNLDLFNFFQMIVVASFSFVLAIFLEGFDSVLKIENYKNINAILGLLFMGVFSTTIGFVFQVRCQKYIKGHVAGVIYLIESPFAAVLGFYLFNEKLTVYGVTGCIFIVISIVMLLLEKEIKAKLTL